MEGESRKLWDTREFVAQWNAATEAHLVQEMRGVVARWAAQGTLPALAAAQSDRLAELLVHAFQVAAAPDGGPHLAIQYLSELAAPPAQGAG